MSRVTAARPRRKIARRILLILLLLVLGAIGLFVGYGGDGGLLARFRLKPDSVIVERQPDAAYEKLFPYYVELCTVSQVRRRDGSQGNPFGHAAMYLKGACKDETAPFPQLRRCHHVATDVDDPEHGAGVSVGRWFRNINWVAVPGHELFYNGNLKPGERLTQERFDATVQTAIDKGVFDGVEFHPGWTRNPNPTLRDYVGDQSITTDFALRYARNVFCARVPVTETVLDEVMAFLNDKNREYATGKADYRWNLLTDNCVHTVRNALAAANAWSPISVRQLKILSLLNLAVPANEFVNLAVLGSDGPLDDYHEIYDKDPSRDSLNDFKWLPTRQGALIKTLPVHEPNDIYNTDFRLFTIQSPLWMTKTNHAIELMSDKRTVELEDNLRSFLDRYDTILANYKDQLDGLATVRGDPYRRFGRLYYSYIKEQRDDVEAKLAQLAAMRNAAATAEAGGMSSNPANTGASNLPLTQIPMIDVEADWPVETLRSELARAHALLDAASHRFPRFAVTVADAVSRRWLARWHEPYLAEIDRIAALIGRPGAYFLNVSYEWGCTSSALPSPNGEAPLLSRVLDWPEEGLGRHMVAARIHSPVGRWLSLTWPGYIGVLQAVAPGRFAAALNQAPMAMPVGLYPLDWLVNRTRVWRQPHLTAAHLLRKVFEEAPDFATAKAMLTKTPIALPTIYILAGVAPGETCVIERMPEASHVIDGSASAANAWQAPRWSGRPRGDDNAARQAAMRSVRPSLDPAFPWLTPPVLNAWTRLVFAANAASGAFVARGYEAGQPATVTLQAQA